MHADKLPHLELKSKLEQLFPNHCKQPRHQIERAVLQASNQYLFKENMSLWNKPDFTTAYLNYFIHTQLSRLIYVFNKTTSFFNTHPHLNITDFGCGPGTTHLAFKACFPKHDALQNWTQLDHAQEALSVAKKLCPGVSTLKAKHIPTPTKPSSLLVLSYALCEGFNCDEMFSYDHILILEPGQYEHSQNLIRVREQALKTHGFFAWAPCTHQNPCPMMGEKKWWCHDQVKKPPHLNELKLPFSSEKLNLSYLLLSRTPISENLAWGRMVGDTQKEKGKSKIAVCHKEGLHFLSWLKKTKLQPELNRGDLIAQPGEAHDTKCESKGKAKSKIRGMEIRIAHKPTKLNSN